MRIYIVKNCYGGVRYYQNDKVYKKQLIKLKNEYDQYQRHPNCPKIEVYYADDKSNLHLIETYP